MKDRWIEAGNSLYNLNKIVCIACVENNDQITLDQITLVHENGNESHLYFRSRDERNEAYETIKKELLK